MSYPYMFQLRTGLFLRFALICALLAACLVSPVSWAQGNAPINQNGQGGWQGLANLLEAITPNIDTRVVPSNADSHQHIADMIARGLLPEALQAIAARKSEQENSVVPGTDVQLLFLQARVLSALQRHEEANTIYRSMTVLYPELPEPWNNLAVGYVRLNQLARAQDALQMALNAAPNYATAHANLGTVQLLLAQKSLQDAAQSGDPDAQQKAQTIERLLNSSSSPTPAQGMPLMSTNPQVILHTNQGDIHIELDADRAPKTVENFINYVRDGFYDGTIFHRVINNFMIQGGGFDADMQQKTTRAPVHNEADNGLKNARYTLAMARTSDPHSATAQFFINVSDNDFLNFTAPNANGWGYAVFGKIVQGMEVVDSIKTVKTTNRGFHQDVPLETIVIEKTTLVQ